MKKLLLLLFVIGSLSAQVFTDSWAGTAAGAGAGGAQVAVNQSMWAHSYNPAGLAFIDKVSGGFAFNSPGSYGFALPCPCSPPRFRSMKNSAPFHFTATC